MISVLLTLTKIALVVSTYLAVEYFANKYQAKRNERAMRAAAQALEDASPMSKHDMDMIAALRELTRQEYGDDPCATLHAMSMEDRAYSVIAFVNSAAERMGIKLSDVMLFQDSSGNHIGVYNEETNTLLLNVQLLADRRLFNTLMEAIFHELRHAYQLWVIQNPQSGNVSTETAEVWQNNWDNYIQSDTDFELYYKQPIEVNARKFSRLVMEEANDEN